MKTINLENNGFVHLNINHICIYKNIVGYDILFHLYGAFILSNLLWVVFDP